MEQEYDIIVPMTIENLPVFQRNVEWMKKNLSGRRIFVVGAEVLKVPAEKLGVEFIPEDTVVLGMSLGQIRTCLEGRLGNGNRAGWYFQQFLKLGYAFRCREEYYIVWDADTIPLQRIRHMIDGHPVFTKKEEMEPAYFETLEHLFGGDVTRFGNFSFICENMIFHVEIVKEMLERIMEQPGLSGNSFWERILSAVSDESLPQSGFSEFETYGNYVMRYHPGLYHLRTLQGLRKGAEYFGMSPTETQLRWAARSYDTIAFERWSCHRRILGFLCGNPCIRALLPLSFLVWMKTTIANKRQKGRSDE